MEDKIEVKESFFVQLVVSLLMTCAYLHSFLQTVIQLPIIVVLVIVVNMYFNAIVVGYKLKSKRLKLQWCFISPFVYNFKPKIFNLRSALGWKRSG